MPSGLAWYGIDIDINMLGTAALPGASIRTRNATKGRTRWLRGTETGVKARGRSKGMARCHIERQGRDKIKGFYMEYKRSTLHDTIKRLVWARWIAHRGGLSVGLLNPDLLMTTIAFCLYDRHAHEHWHFRRTSGQGVCKVGNLHHSRVLYFRGMQEHHRTTKHTGRGRQQTALLYSFMISRITMQ